jgi:hypothetical protein
VSCRVGRMLLVASPRVVVPGMVYNNNSTDNPSFIPTLSALFLVSGQTYPSVSLYPLFCLPWCTAICLFPSVL